MNDKIRILGIAPYNGMKTQMIKAAEDYKDRIDLVVLDGDLQEGVSAARNNFHGDFDVIISRGGTARMIRDQVSVPVVEIDLTDYDILRAMRLDHSSNSWKLVSALITLASVSSNWLAKFSIKSFSSIIKSFINKKYD